MHRLLPENIQHLKVVDIHVPSGIWTHNPQTHTLDHAVTGMDFVNILEAINDSAL